MRLFSLSIFFPLLLITSFYQGQTPPSSANDYLSRGAARVEKGDVDGAIADFTKAIEINPQFAQAYGNRGLARLAQANDAEARQDFDKCFSLDSTLKSHYQEGAKKLSRCANIGD